MDKRVLRRFGGRFMALTVAAVAVLSDIVPVYGEELIDDRAVLLTEEVETLQPAPDQGLSANEADQTILAPEVEETDGQEIYEPDTATEADVIHYPISIDINGYGSSHRIPDNSYSASTPEVVMFTDYKGMFNVARTGSGSKGFRVNRYDPSTMKMADTIMIEPEDPSYYYLKGNITCDGDGNYYAVWGHKAPENDPEAKVLCISKYDYSGTEVKKLEIAGVDMGGEEGGTLLPFRSGNCSLAVNNGILAINHSKQRYDIHQQSIVIYIRCSDMIRVNGNEHFTGHSFDQRIYPADNGRFIAVNQGDGGPRGFKLGMIELPEADTYGKYKAFTTFHFREGTNREYGYNETFAQIGGIAELEDRYVFAASSERRLSMAVKNSLNTEARDLFIQIIKKDLDQCNSVNDIYAVSGETRTPVDNKPESAKTMLFLDGTEVDKGIIWLTHYDDDHYVANPKVVALPGGNIAIMWEKLAYSYNDSSCEVYYMLIDGEGRIVAKPMFISGCHLAADIDPMVYNGNIYWATADEFGQYIHKLNICNSYSGVEITKQPYILSSVLNPDGTYDLKLSVEADNAVSYRWQSSSGGYDFAEAEGTEISGNDTSALTVSRYSPDNPVFYRCVIKDQTGLETVSHTAVGIVEDAKSITAKAGEKAVFKVVPFGAIDLRWYFQPADSSQWLELSSSDRFKGTDTPMLSFTIDSYYGSGKYRCRFRTVDGAIIYSEPVSITRQLTILEQPKSVYAKKGEEFTINFTPDGEGLTYQWYLKYKDEPWVAIKPPLGTFPRITYTADDVILNSVIKCIVKDKYGASMETDIVRVYDSMSFGLDKHEITLVSRPGSTARLTPVIVGDYDEDSLIWTSSDENVATVYKGLVTAKEGITEDKTAVITVKTPDDEYSDSCTVTVVPVTTVETPYASAGSGEVDEGTVISLACKTEGAQIYYTTDDTKPGVDANGNPTGTTKLYTDVITLNKDTVIRAIAVKENCNDSAEARYEYTVRPDWGDIPDMLKDVFESPAGIPEGIWYLYGNETRGYRRLDVNDGKTGLEYEYNGGKIEIGDDLLMFDGRYRLCENRDYTLSYANNTVAAGESAPKAPALRIKGKGRYKMNTVLRFAITPADINDCEVSTGMTMPLAAGKKLGSVKPVLKYRGKKLKVQKDYTLKFFRDEALPANEVASPASTVVSEGDKFSITINAAPGSSFKGTITGEVRIVGINGKDKAVVDMSTVKVTLPAQIYTGEPISVRGLFEKEIDVKKGSVSLAYGKDYTVDDLSFTDAGKYSIWLHGTAQTDNGLNCIGDKLLVLDIKGVDSGKVKIGGLASAIGYPGRGLSINDLYLKDKSGYDKVTLYTVADGRNVELTEGTDYEYTITGGSHTGKARIRFTLKGRYSGTIERTISVKPYDIKKDEKGLVKVEVLGSINTKKGPVPVVRVGWGSKVLKENVDYKVTFRLKKTGSGPEISDVTVKGIGNFGGTVKK